MSSRTAHRAQQRALMAEAHADAAEKEMVALRQTLIGAELDVQALSGVVRGVHGALADAGDIPVPGGMTDDLAPAIRALVEEREALRAAKERLAERALAAEAKRLDGEER
jgi:hypothetical protein